MCLVPPEDDLNVRPYWRHSWVCWPPETIVVKMGYSERGGVWQHPERKVIFLGDFIDRGPEQVETVQIARSMVEGGAALAVMGNHEFNAVAWATHDPEWL